ncbi:MAG: KEOPS complex subunit Pcc1 [Candidatus Bathyarchaeia archaeon]
MEAEIALEYDDVRLAEAVAKAVSPDNLKTPSGLSIKTSWQSTRVITYVNYRGKLATFIATIDDLLFCASTAERVLQAARKLE